LALWFYQLVETYQCAMFENVFRRDLTSICIDR